MDTSTVLQRFSDVIDAQDWDGLRALLAPAFHARYVHDGKIFDAAEFVRFNADYPGSWRFRWEDMVTAGNRGVGRAKVSDQDETYYVASFLTIDGAGLITELTEVWTDRVPPG